MKKFFTRILFFNRLLLLSFVHNNILEFSIPPQQRINSPDLTLKNLKYELVKILKIKESVDSLKAKYGDNIEGNFKARLNEIAKLMRIISVSLSTFDFFW